MGGHEGQRGFVFDVELSISGIVEAERELGPVCASFLRGQRKTTSEPADVEGGMVQFEGPLAGMMVSLYKAEGSTAFEEKLYKILLEESVGDGKTRVLGSVVVNMADHLNVEETSAPTLQLMMAAKNGVESAGVQVDIKWGFVKEGSPADDDVASTLSAEDELEEGADHDSGEDDDDGFYSRLNHDGFVPMAFAVFLQDEGEDTVNVSVGCARPLVLPSCGDFDLHSRCNRLLAIGP